MAQKSGVRQYLYLKYFLYFLLLDVLLLNNLHHISIYSDSPGYWSLSFGFIGMMLSEVLRDYFIFKLIPIRLWLLKPLVLFYMINDGLDVINRFLTDYYVYIAPTRDLKMEAYLSGVSTGWLYLVIPMIILIYNWRRFLNRANDVYDNKSFFINLYRPYTNIGYIISILSIPLGSISFVVKGYHYLYNYEGGFKKIKVDSSQGNMTSEFKLVRLPIDTKTILACKRYLDARVGAPYKCIKSNCVTIAKGIPLPFNITKYDFVPSLFMIKVFNWMDFRDEPDAITNH